MQHTDLTSDALAAITLVEPNADNTEESSEITFDIDVEQPSEAISLHPRPHPHHNYHRHHPPREPRAIPFLFPTLADLPGLLVSSVGSIFHDAQIQHLTSSQHRPRLVEIEGESSTSVFEETWSEFMSRIDGNPEFTHVDPLDALYLLHYQWPGKRRERAVDRSHPPKGILKQSNYGIPETQVITSELDAFITALQQDKKQQKKTTEDSAESEEAKTKSYQRRAYCVLFILGFVIVGNLVGGICLIATYHDL